MSKLEQAQSFLKKANKKLDEAKKTDLGISNARPELYLDLKSFRGNSNYDSNTNDILAALEVWGFKYLDQESNSLIIEINNFKKNVNQEYVQKCFFLLFQISKIIKHFKEKDKIEKLESVQPYLFLKLLDFPHEILQKEEPSKQIMKNFVEKFFIFNPKTGDIPSITELKSIAKEVKEAGKNLIPVANELINKIRKFQNNIKSSFEIPQT